jgi:hypothetical protein
LELPEDLLAVVTSKEILIVAIELIKIVRKCFSRLTPLPSKFTEWQFLDIDDDSRTACPLEDGSRLRDAFGDGVQAAQILYHTSRL